MFKGFLSDHKSVTTILPNNATMLPPFSTFMSLHPNLSDICFGLIIRLERSQCCNHHAASSLRSKDVAIVFQKCDSCVLKKQQLCSKDTNVDAGMHDTRKNDFFFNNKKMSAAYSAGLIL